MLGSRLVGLGADGHVEAPSRSEREPGVSHSYQTRVRTGKKVEHVGATVSEAQKVNMLSTVSGILAHSPTIPPQM